MEIEELKNEIGCIPAMNDGYVTDDNVAIALATYFENLSECPDGDTNSETGWSQWAMDKTDDVLDRIVGKLPISQLAKLERIKECAVELVELLKDNPNIPELIYMELEKALEE